MRLYTKQYCVRVYNRVNESRLIVGIRKASMSQNYKGGAAGNLLIKGPDVQQPSLIRRTCFFGVHSSTFN